MRSSKTAALFSAAVAGLAFASPAHAVIQYIGVNFTGGSFGGAPTAMLPTDESGVIPQTNWNNVDGQVGTNVALKDASGSNTPVTLSFAGAGTWGVNIGAGDANHRLMNGYVDGTDNGTNTYTFNNVPAGNYNLIVYALPDGLDGRDQSAVVNGNVANAIWISSDAGSNFDVNGFVRATGTFQDGPGATGNYYEFDNISPIGGTITLAATSRNFRNFSNGMQLVIADPVPEPATLGFVGLGAVGLLARRRRRQ
jgi:hypothetical protein